MKLNLVLAVAYVFAAQTMVQAECYIGSGGLTDKQKSDLRTCHNNYDSWTWNGQNCGGKAWFRGHDPGWQSPNDCKSLCAECIDMGISAGAQSVECWWKSSPAVRCWTGYK